MRSRSRGRRRSVDRGTCGAGIQPRKTITPGRRRCKEMRKAPSGAPISRGEPESRAVRDPEHVRKHLAREPGDPRFAQRLLEFGPYAIDQRQWRGEGKPETFNFFGFTHICVKKKSNGRFTVLRQTIRKRMQTKLNEVKAELQRRMHEPIPEQGKWLRAV